MNRVARDTLVYNGRALTEFNVFFDGSKSFGTPEKDYELISIPGRNGDLSIFNNRYKDITVTFPCFIRDNFVENYRNLMAFLNGSNGYLRLETSKEPDHFRKALFLGSVEPKTGSFNKSGYFDLTFRCHPQRWLKSGERWTRIESEDYDFQATIYNPTLQPAKPLIRFYGRGTVNIGGRMLGVGTTEVLSYDYAEADCDISDVYAPGGINLNNAVFGSFPILNPGNNNIRCIGNQYDDVKFKIDIMPRWFEI